MPDAHTPGGQSDNIPAGNATCDTPEYSVSRHLLKKQIHRETVGRIDLRNNCLDAKDATLIRLKAEKEIHTVIGMQKLNESVSTELKKEVLDEIFDLGPLKALLEDDDITEIMVIGCDSIYIEKGGKILQTNFQFISNTTLFSIIERVISAVNRRIDENAPCVDARLPDGSRVNAVIAPVSRSGPCLTIRKFTKSSVTVKDLVTLGTLTEEAVSYLENAVKRRANIIVGGGTGSGKTTLLNALSSFIPEDSRIITIEDSAELKLQKPHVVSLEARPPNIEGRGEITIRDLLRNSLRMRPDRLIIGECRGGETLDMLQAMNTGHDGSMTTAHANSPRDLISRIETMALYSGLDLPVRAIREQIASAVDLIVFLARLGCGGRKVTSITEITGISDLSIMTQEIIAFDRREGNLKKTGIRSKLGDHCV